MERLHARGIEVHYAAKPILRGCDFSVEEGERVGLVGPNGSGKSTLVKVLAKKSAPDHGKVEWRGSVSLLEQEPALEGETVADAVAAATRWHAELLAAWEAAVAAGDEAASVALQARLDTVGWEPSFRVDALLSALGAPPKSAEVARLSGGERRRVALALKLLEGSEVLILDEPTNHLDAEAIEWLEGYLKGWRGALVLVTHDRYLLESLATRIVEVEDGLCVSYDGAYTDYLIGRAERRAALEKSEASRLSMIQKEAEWASRSPAAQTVKQKARLDRLATLQAQRPLPKDASFALDLTSGFRLGSTIVELRSVKKRFHDKLLFQQLDLSLRAGERLGLLGPNGCGKSTLLRMVAGKELPDAGHVVRGGRVQLAFLDQARSGLNPNHTVYEAAGSGNDQVKVGERWVHVTSFLQSFLFHRDSFQRKVETLSGGERARLLVARLMLQGANLLLLDEPTNDLDLMTLRVLEEALTAFDGVVLVVSHDRAFLDRVCTGVLAFEGNGTVVRYADRAQAIQAAKAAEAAAEAAAKEQARKEQARKEQAEREAKAAAPVSSAPKTGRLSFKEQKELEGLPAQIEAMEAKQAALTASMAAPGFWQQANAAEQAKSLTTLSEQLAAAYARWEALESRKG